MLLEALEAGFRNEFAETKSVPKGLTIEHVMPQGWREHWRLTQGGTAEQRDRSVHTMGNLTLLNEKLNPHQSHRPWIDGDTLEDGKREALKNHSVLYLNKALLKFDDWSEAQIEERSKELFVAALKIWPHRVP